MAYTYTESNIVNLKHLKKAASRSQEEISSLAGLVAGAIEDEAFKILRGTCTTAAATKDKVATLSDPTQEIRDGMIIGIKFTNTNTGNATAENPITLNVNGSGAKNIYYAGSANPTGTNPTAFGRADYYNFYFYDGTYWVWVGSSEDNDTTYTNVALGQGYGTCQTAGATTEKAVPITGYELVANGIVTVKFVRLVPAGATLNVNTKGAKPIYYRGAAITDGVIAAGDVATFIYNGSQYILIAIDRDEVSSVNGKTGAVTLTHSDVGALEDIGLYIDSSGYLCQRINEALTE